MGNGDLTKLAAAKHAIQSQSRVVRCCMPKHDKRHLKMSNANSSLVASRVQWP